ncbi:hypothetical protein ACQEXU_04060 [Vibrio sp. TRT 21S02]|uniref:hypothetical protein n=1 Tax=unclassified Vibrio TaxID=2614977 RepID=UPI00349F5682
MKYKGILVFIAFGLFVVIGSKQNWFGSSDPQSFPKLPAHPDFVISKKYDGQWEGRRINVTNNNMCERTTITGKIEQGKASLLLTYNGTALQGWVSESGELVLYANHRQWDYRFSANGTPNKLEGKWHLTNGPCRGTWFIKKI